MDVNLMFDRLENVDVGRFILDESILDIKYKDIIDMDIQDIIDLNTKCFQDLEPALNEPEEETNIRVLIRRIQRISPMILNDTLFI